MKCPKCSTEMQEMDECYICNLCCYYLNKKDIKDDTWVLAPLPSEIKKGDKDIETIPKP